MEENENLSVPFVDIIDQVCRKLNCSVLAADLERVNHAREMLANLQQKKVLSSFLGDAQSVSPIKTSHLQLKAKVRLNTSEISETDLFPGDFEVDEAAEEFENIDNNCIALSEDSWLGFFKGYEILTEGQEIAMNENKQCIEISHSVCNSTLQSYLRLGIRCFAIDLFQGTALENQSLIFKLRESELAISREYGFPITATLFALLSPRCQYTGLLEQHPHVSFELKKQDSITLTTCRQYSMRGNRDKIYVNARFLIDDCRLGDFILVGPTIQLQVAKIEGGDLCCSVMEPGVLRSRLPVRFPGRCDCFSISVEELEDITFAREVGINVLVFCMPGTKAYLDDLQKALRLLNCENLRICCRVVLNEIQDKEPIQDLDWIADRYDGFVIDLTPLQQRDKCQDHDFCMTQSEVLHLSSSACKFLQKAFQLKKPIIMDPTLISNRKLFVCRANMRDIFYCPDKYMFKSVQSHESFYFNLLQNSIFQTIAPNELSAMPYCDTSHTGSDSLARCCVTASFESHAVAILACSNIPDMPIKLSHFRPAVPIFYISAIKSTGDYISMYHNIMYLYFKVQSNDCPYQEFVTQSLVYGLAFLKCRKIVKRDQNVMLVYGTESGTRMPDNYLLYKFDDENFANHMNDILFP